MYTSRMRMNGFSGMDVDSMVQSLMEAESMKLHKLQRKSQLLTWRQESYRTIGKSLDSFQKNFLSYTKPSTNMRSSNAFANFKTSVATKTGETSKAVSVRTNAAAKKGTYELEVLKLATTATETGDSATTVSGDADMSNVFKNLAETDNGSLSFKAIYNGKEETITITAEDIKKLNLNAPSTPFTTPNKVKLENLINEKLDIAFGKHDESFGKDVNKLTFSLNSDGSASFSVTEGNTFSLKAASNKEENDFLKAAGIENGASNKVNMDRTLKDIFGKEEDCTITINDQKITLLSTDSIEQVMKKINDSKAGVEITQNKLTGAFTLTAKEAGAGGRVEFGFSGTDDTESILKGIFGFSKPASQKGEDSVIKLNGTLIQSASNYVTVSDYGLSIDLTEKTSEPLYINVEADVDATFDKIKSFIDSYNEMLTAMQDEVKTTRPKSDKYTYYEPLVDSEKESLSDDEIEKYEEKAKKGLLYNDSTIKTIISKLRSAMSAPVTLEDGTTISLASIGITTTADYMKGGLLTIDENKLKEAISTDPDAVAKLFNKAGNEAKDTGVANRLNSAIDGAIHYSTGSITKVAGFENSMSSTSNTIYDQLKDLKSRMDTMLDTLTKKENMYYKKFSAMESAMMKSESQLSNIMSLFGSN